MAVFLAVDVCTYDIYCIILFIFYISILIDMSSEEILSKLNMIIEYYGEVNPDNEGLFYKDVMNIVFEIENYKQTVVTQQKSEKDLIVLVKKVINKLKTIPVAGSVYFPSNVIELLWDEHLNTLKKFCENPVFWFAS